MLTPLNIPPGMFRNGTAYQNAARWNDGNLVRWFGGTIRPVGGWLRACPTQLSGSARGLYTWRENNFNARVAIGTHTHLYIYSAGSLHDITPTGFTAGRADGFIGYGYGYSNYNVDDYNESTSARNLLDASTWNLDSWGEHLVACCTTDGRLYEWENVPATAAAVITNAPTGCSGLLVTPERHLIALGAGGVGRAIAWCTSEDNTVWAPLATNSAGGLELKTQSRILKAKLVRGQILIWTEMDLHVMQYLGPPYIYGVEKVGAFCGIISPNAASEVEGGAAWMSQDGFFLYDGSLKALSCEVSDYVFSDFNKIQKSKVYAGHNSRFGEAWWFYPSAASNEVDRYVSWNYRENHWATGSLPRTCWADSGVYPYPLAVGADGYLYEHENGWTANGTALAAARFAQSGPVELGDGDRVTVVSRTVPDEKTSGQVQFTYRARFSPEGAEYVFGPYPVAPFIDTRFTGRQVAVEVEGLADADWRLGKLRLDVVPGGKR